jgi:hypothetical protein
VVVITLWAVQAGEVYFAQQTGSAGAVTPSKFSLREETGAQSVVNE